jgi:hypothetical protein
MNSANWSELKRLLSSPLNGDSCNALASLFATAAVDRDSNLWFYSLVAPRLMKLASDDAFREADVADSLFNELRDELRAAIEQIEAVDPLRLIQSANHFCKTISDLNLLVL